MDKKCNEKQFKNFGKNISLLRKQHGFSKKRMCQILSIGVSSLNKLEQGIIPKRLSVDIVFRIEGFFKIPAKEQFKKI